MPENKKEETVDLEPIQTKDSIFGKRKLMAVAYTLIFCALALLVPVLFSLSGVKPELLKEYLPLAELIGKGVLLMVIMVFFGVNMIKKNQQ